MVILAPPGMLYGIDFDLSRSNHMRKTYMQHLLVLHGILSVRMGRTGSLLESRFTHGYAQNVGLYVSMREGPPPCSTVVRASARGAEAGVRFPTASDQRRKKWEVCTSQLGAWQ